MAKQTKQQGVDPRDLFLAGLGAVSLTRKQASKAFGLLVEEGAQFRDVANQRIEKIAGQARANLKLVKSKVEAKAGPFLSKAGSMKHEVESRLAPVLATFKKVAPKPEVNAPVAPSSKKVAAKKVGVKPATKKVASKRPVAKKAA